MVVKSVPGCRRRDACAGHSVATSQRPAGPTLPVIRTLPVLRPIADVTVPSTLRRSELIRTVITDLRISRVVTVCHSAQSLRARLGESLGADGRTFSKTRRISLPHVGCGPEPTLKRPVARDSTTAAVTEPSAVGACDPSLPAARARTSDRPFPAAARRGGYAGASSRSSPDHSVHRAP